MRTPFSSRPTTTTAHDADGRAALVTDPNGHQSAMYYDSRGRATVSVLDLDGDGFTTPPGTEADLPQALATDPGDVTTRTGYDLNGNTTYALDPRGNRSDIEYDAADRAVRSLAPAVADAQNSGTMTRPEVLTQYDRRSLITRSTDPRGVQTRSVYDALGRATDVYAADGTADEVRTSTTYDLNGNADSLTLHNNVPDSLLRDTSTSSAYEFIQHRDTQPNLTTGDRYAFAFTVDKVASPTHHPGVAVVQLFANGGYQRHAYTVNVATGTLALRTDLASTNAPAARVVDLGSAWRVEVEFIAHPLTQDLAVTFMPAANANASGLWGGAATGDTSFRGLTLAHVETDGSWTPRDLPPMSAWTTYSTLQVLDDARPQQTTYTYDAFDRQISETLPGVGDGLTRTTTTQYSRGGDVLSVTDARGQRHESDYDRAGRKTATRHYQAPSGGGSGTLDETRAFAYDAAGNLLTATDLHGGSTYQYDPLNRLTHETRSDTGRPAYSVQHWYDAAGNRTGVVYPDAAGNGQGPASGGGSRELAFVHDRRNLLAAVIDGNPAAAQTTYTYDLSGNRTQLTLPNGVTTLASFDPLNRVTLLENVKMGAGGADAYEVGYTYDLAGNRITSDETWDVGGDVGGGVGTPSSKDTTYGYDALYRLTSESYAQAGFLSGNGSHAYGYTYDDAGNRLTKTVDGTRTAYAYDDLNRLLSEGGHTYTYDRNGNRTGKSESGGDATTYAYDTHDRMVSVDRGGQRVFDAEYDYRTRRLAKTEGAETTVYRYDGGTSFQEVQDGVITLELIRGTGMGGGIGSILYTDRHDNSGGGPPGSLTTEYFAYNAVGHTVAMTDATGNVTKTNAYEAFGAVVAESGSSDNNKLANTKERDATTGLDNHGFRYYDPTTGLYITRDPIGYGDGLNVYLYVGGNPVNRVDPQGLRTGWDDTKDGWYMVRHYLLQPAGLSPQLNRTASARIGVLNPSTPQSPVGRVPASRMQPALASDSNDWAMKRDLYEARSDSADIMVPVEGGIGLGNGAVASSTEFMSRAGVLSEETNQSAWVAAGIAGTGTEWWTDRSYNVRDIAALGTLTLFSGGTVLNMVRRNGDEVLETAGDAARIVDFSPRRSVGQLSEKQQSAIAKINNINQFAARSGPKGEIAGAVSDMVGNPIPKPGGGTYDHVKELNDALRGLRNHAKTLDGVSDPTAAAARQVALDKIAEIEAKTQGAGL